MLLPSPLIHSFLHLPRSAGHSSQRDGVHGVRGVHEAGGKKTAGGGARGGKGRSGSKAGSGPVETAATGPAGEASGLPFTGSDVLVLAGIGWLLLLAGVAGRRFGGGARRG
jgi:hypothetical protein